MILRQSTAQISLGAKESSIDSYPHTERSREIQKKVPEYMMLNTLENYRSMKSTKLNFPKVRNQQ